MQHLTLEALARLVDEAPARGEAAHLETCEACRIELEQLIEDARALHTLAGIEPPPGSWATLEARLVREGLIRDARPSRLGRAFALLRWAAAIALFLLGGGAGFAVRGAIGSQPFAANETEGGRITAAGDPLDAADAARMLRTAEAEYLRALTRYAELADAPAVADPVARLAALEGIVLATRTALGQAPADPVINGYHLTAVAQREATLRQFATVADDDWF